MTRTLWTGAVVFCLIGTSSPNGETAGKTYTNPVIDEIGPADPSVILHDGRYYLYCTGDNRSYHVYYSTDLVHWTKGRLACPLFGWRETKPAWNGGPARFV